ncbi:MAG: ABC transporter permease [Coriobacteriia bacterium]|nr:ABC transporter permease [Actinomycetota bacterium]MDZ4166281.1 ABC transporter permease [Coriobacteriia bacterium]
MRGFHAFLAKELREILRTWRIWVLPGIVLFFALSGPPLAKFTPELLGTFVNSEQTGMVIQLPDPTYVDAYLQWTKNLQQLVLFAVIIMFGGIVSAEKRAGTTALVLTKPLSRTAFVLAKYVSQALLVIASVVLGALLTWGLTYAIFAEAPVAPLVEATGAWLALGLMFLALMELFSSAMDSQAGAAGLGFLGFIAIGIATLWAPAVEYSPAGLLGAPTALVIGESVALGWPVGSTLALTALLVATAVLVFRRREL